MIITVIYITVKLKFPVGSIAQLVAQVSQRSCVRIPFKSDLFQDLFSKLYIIAMIIDVFLS